VPVFVVSTMFLTSPSKTKESPYFIHSVLRREHLDVMSCLVERTLQSACSPLFCVLDIYRPPTISCRTSSPRDDLFAAVYTMTNGATKNEILVDRLDAEGQLTWVRSMDTKEVRLNTAPLLMHWPLKSFDDLVE
jgi:hypothetical protein